MNFLRQVKNMPRNYKPETHSVCAECGQPINNEEYHWTKSKGYPPVFIHKRCFEGLLPKNKELPTCKTTGK